MKGLVAMVYAGGGRMKPMMRSSEGGGGRRESRRGSVILLLFIAIVVVFITTNAIHFMLRSRYRQVIRAGDSTVAAYLARAGLARGVMEFRALFSRPLLRRSEDGTFSVDEEVLSLLDRERARFWQRRLVIDGGRFGLGDEARVEVFMELLAVTGNEFSAMIDRRERIPKSLEPYQEKRTRRRRDTMQARFGVKPLGGWSGILRLVASGRYRGAKRVVECFRPVKVLDVTPPAPDYTLFISSSGRETLKEGRFVLSNFDLPPQVRDKIFELTCKVDSLLRMGLSEKNTDTRRNVEKLTSYMSRAVEEDKMDDAVRYVFELADQIDDESISDTVDNIILSLNPINWGRVRTNGRLDVYLPFFTADDIINYFADDSFFGRTRPEVGYPFCDNRLHDPYMSVYTRYEGRIYKHYQRLIKDSTGRVRFQPVPPQRYTINTRLNYVRRHPERRAVPFLERIEKNAARDAQRLVKHKLVLHGDEEHPMRIEGMWYCLENVSIGGAYTGRGMLVCERGITVTDDLRPLSKDDILSIVALKGAVVLSDRKSSYSLRASLYAREGLRGKRDQAVRMRGNLVVHELRRPSMPGSFTCRFDPTIRNRVADNVVAVVGGRTLVVRELRSGWTPEE